MIEKPTILTIETHGKKFSAELPWDTNIYDLMGAMKGLLVSTTSQLTVVVYELFHCVHRHH